ncbi:hypothetical protein FGSG_02334 [Fusarium graminearum PH-1]|uniref:Chromosome 1, complete genome n=1 Tax=Gibberella zeae (strain ATCC MYA-4620 / CBS 123657 / FGSC 9075 / NRRL 31084 / PH-1) TaxID=229533 RepID=I1RF68_GIBZE|nr:hypothetical protein FGSG_02334 [Fusarium graminearum PH-1]ESU07758.1 hypothetical protein FGSG_02334 [Fusarium graminearum PH-1]EYB30999.1 hypothetical protein FG05_02334 [Fusarium graminearum]CEF74611.1 unnamed protein product [Fusarium graminearum]|eukprot:XP_011318243.1 hypothetical protein FGSG_02334 [Fusarium graminearum PH-1]
MNPVSQQLIEIWILYTIGILIIAARVFCRTKLVGYKNYDWDDYLVVLVGFFWTAAVIFGRIFIHDASGRHTSDLDFEQRKNMDTKEYEKWAYGSQMFFVSLILNVVILWTLKLNMLCLYKRVVRGLCTERFVKPLMAQVLVSFTVIILTLALTCRPFNQLWQVWPDPGPKCVPQNLTFFVLILSFNLSTDVCIMLIPIPVVLGIQVNPLKRFCLCLLFSLGFLCMSAAILRFIVILKLNQHGGSVMWSLREDCIGIFVGQAPMLRPLFKRRFWISTNPVSSSSVTWGKNGHLQHVQNQLESHEVYWLGRKPNSKMRGPHSITSIRSMTGSQEHIVQGDQGPIATPEPRYDRSSGIVVERRVDIEVAGAGGTYTVFAQKSAVVIGQRQM